MTTDTRFKLERRGDVPELDPDRTDFYRAALELLNRENLPYLVGGTHAYHRYTGIARQTKDFDLFVERSRFPAIGEAFRKAGEEVILTFPHWLAKVKRGPMYIDLIFSGGNGEAAVDEGWMEHGVEGQVFGLPVRLVAPEEMIWSKSYVMERERYDGGDVMHLILRTGRRLDWDRLVRRFGDHWRLLLMQIVKFGFVYPSERFRIPREVVEDLMLRFQHELSDRSSREKICFGTLTSRAQYLVDINEWGFTDARLQPIGGMSPEDVDQWTAAIKEE